MFFVFLSFISLSDLVFSNFLDDHVNKVLRCHGLASLSLTVVKDDETVLHRGYGFADTASQTPVDGETLYAVGSLSKGFTSLLLEYYQEGGLLSLEAPIAAQMRDAGISFNISTNSHNESYNMKDLLGHRTGLSNYMGFEFMSNFTRAKLFEDMFYRDEDQVGDYRDSFIYNNWLYATAARAGEMLSGEVYEREVERLIFKHLGMDAGFGNDEEFVRRNKERIAKPYFYQAGQNLLVEDSVWGSVGAFSPAGGVMTSGEDMAKWMKFLLNEGRTNARQRLVKRATITNMFKPLNNRCCSPTSKTTFPWNSNCVGYGEGWFLSQFQGSPEFGHTGNFYNVHRSKISMFPELNLGIFYAFSGGMPISRSKNMFDVLDPVIVETIVNGSFDPDKYEMINDLMEKWGCNTASRYWNHFGGSESDPGSLQAAGPDMKGLPTKGAPKPPPNLVLAHLTDQYVGTFKHPFLGKAEVKYDANGIAKLVLNDAWQSRMYDSHSTEDSTVEQFSEVSFVCFFDNIPWLPANVEDSNDNKMIIVLRPGPSSSSTKLQYLDITWWIRYNLEPIIFSRINE